MKLMLMELRKSAGYKSRDDFAAAIGVNRHTYKSWETGAVTMNLEQACMVADALHCTLDELAGRVVPPRHAYADTRQEALNRIYEAMNDAGKTKAVDNVRDLAGNPAYQEGSKSGVDAAEIGA